MTQYGTIGESQEVPLLCKQAGGAKEEKDYYGQNDWKPFRKWSCGKKVCTPLLCIIFSPLILALLILWLISMVVFFIAVRFGCMAFSKSQEAVMKTMLFEFRYKAPGMKLELETSGDTSDLIIPHELVDKNGLLHTCGGLGWSLRKSIEHTVEDHIRNCPLGAKVLGDTDADKPRYFLNGSTRAYDPNFDEAWMCPGRFCVWPAVYSWAFNLPEGLNGAGFTQTIDLKDAPDVFGYVFFFEVGNQQFYDTDRVEKVGRLVVNCPEVTPENEGKIFARYGYDKAREMGNIPDISKVPDAYIFKGKTLKDAQLKLLHTYRVMKPVV